MKKIIFAALMFCGFSTFANSTDNFTYNEQEVNQTFSALKPLEKVVDKNPNLKAEDIVAAQPNLVDNVDLAPTNALDNGRSMPLVSPFWWGCCLGVIGLLFVYLRTDNDRIQTKSAFWGCLISTILVGTGGILKVWTWF